MKNANCDGSGPCDPGRVRVLPLGTSPHHGNLILCRCCFNREIEYRRERNRELAEDCRFKLPVWTSLEIYGETKPAEAQSCQHTPEPWITDGRMIVQEVDGRSFWSGQPYIADFLVSEAYRAEGSTKANARRAVACVNACAGMSDPAAELARIRTVNAQLREALQALLEYADNGTPVHPGAEVWQDARAALAGKGAA